ncbi:lytic transglycosylase F [Pseudomonas solani]|uniref:Lytic transglycosylase F n=1 Tax=Pseudomonas solani TaxID=2731552 RepID=A0ABN6BUV9_9PSED|nr:transglycosylase SLT domain-containing protein [Pseudomonas solani]EQM68414.1 glycosylase [Pseudomonas alcaligenes OT 69]MBB4819578.1 membrane-bound lytic murein transglycosylase MltF [Pseudomonas alcaligenes]MDN4148050.1 transglycosylase SLT domain-containing protein [Pseudomonas tohonis]BCD87598.1 lytic transglycosylase F [Pseudomonas solani]
MTRPLLLLLCLLALLPFPAAARLAGPPEAWQQPSEARDLAQIRRSGVLRVLVNQSRNSSGEIKGEAIGIEYHRIRAFEQYLNRNARDGRELEVKIIPRAKDQLLAALLRGEGDLVAPGELVDPRSGGEVSASAPIRRHVPLLLVSRSGDRRYQRLEQLAGRSIALPAGSAAAEALRRVNQQLAERKLAPIVIEWVDSSLAVEDVLEMVQAGIFPLTAVEQPIAERWAKVMPKLRIEKHLVLDNQRDMTWFVRRDAPMLRASIDRFLAGYNAPSDQDATFQRVYRRLYKVHSPLARADRQRLEKVRPVLQRFADQHAFDWLNLAAVAFKESSLNPAARGASGATGLMQITPGAARTVGVGNIHALENNVQASAKYLAMLRKGFFNSAQLNERERMAFTLAAYNVGPQRVQSLRAEARRRGLNPNQWFFQVERIAAEQLGMGVVSYVSAVNKYYLAYDRERYLLEPQKKVASRGK